MCLWMGSKAIRNLLFCVDIYCFTDKRNECYTTMGSENGCHLYVTNLWRSSVYYSDIRTHITGKLHFSLGAVIEIYFLCTYVHIPGLQLEVTDNPDGYVLFD